MEEKYKKELEESIKDNCFRMEGGINVDRLASFYLDRVIVYLSEKIIQDINNGRITNEVYCQLLAELAKAKEMKK